MRLRRRDDQGAVLRHLGVRRHWWLIVGSPRTMIWLWVLRLVGRRIPLRLGLGLLVLIVRIWRHHRAHALRIVLVVLVAVMWTHMRPSIGRVVLPLMRSYWHSLPRRNSVRIHSEVVGKSLLEQVHHESRVGCVLDRCDRCGIRTWTCFS